MSVVMDLSRDGLFDELGMARLRESYMKDEEISPQERFAAVSEQFSSNPAHAQRLYDYSYSTGCHTAPPSCHMDEEREAYL